MIQQRAETGKVTAVPSSFFGGRKRLELRGIMQMTAVKFMFAQKFWLLYIYTVKANLILRMKITDIPKRLHLLRLRPYNWNNLRREKIVLLRRMILPNVLLTLACHYLDLCISINSPLSDFIRRCNCRQRDWQDSISIS